MLDVRAQQGAIARAGPIKSARAERHAGKLLKQMKESGLRHDGQGIMFCSLSS
jgi:hypothetical protein